MGPRKWAMLSQDSETQNSFSSRVAPNYPTRPILCYNKAMETLPLRHAVAFLELHGHLKPMDAHWIKHFNSQEQHTWGQDFEYLIYERLTTKFTKKFLREAGISMDNYAPVVEPANLDRPKSPWNWRWTHIQRVRAAESAKEPRTIDWDAQTMRFVVKFGFDRALIQELKEATPRWPKWDNDKWTMLPDARIVDGLKLFANRNNFTVSAQAFEMLDSLEDAPKGTIALYGDNYVVAFDYDAALIPAMRKLGSFDRAAKAWLIPKQMTPRKREQLREFVMQNQDFAVSDEARLLMNSDLKRVCPSCEQEREGWAFGNDYLCQSCRS